MGWFPVIEDLVTVLDWMVDCGEKVTGEQNKEYDIRLKTEWLFTWYFRPANIVSLALSLQSGNIWIPFFRFWCLRRGIRRRFLSSAQITAVCLRHIDTLKEFMTGTFAVPA